MDINKLAEEFAKSPESDKIFNDYVNSKKYKKGCVSDFRAKVLQKRLNNGTFTDDDLHAFDNIMSAIDNESDDNGPITDKYAEHVQNYEYNYKPEATAIDPSINPNETEIGPMAQDIEKVNPSAIVTTPEGVKTVDINKLALMNAGAIADLARDIKQIKEMLNGR